MKSINRWNNTFVRRLMLLTSLLAVIPFILLFGALSGIIDETKDMAGAWRNAWKGVQ